jgi:hypothetical protein
MTKSSKVGISIISITCLLSLVSCFQCQDMPHISSSTKEANKKIEQGGNSQVIFAEGSFEQNTWTQFLRAGNYRLATSADFNIPQSVRDASGDDIDKATKLPCVPEDFNFDGASDRACIIISENLNALHKFSLVIVSGSSANNPIPIVHWLFKQKDLSMTILGWSRDGLGVTQYNNDGTSTVCHVKWDSNQKSFFCK